MNQFMKILLIHSDNTEFEALAKTKVAEESWKYLVNVRARSELN